MSTPAVVCDESFGPWNPGIQSRIPDDLRGYCTIFRPENAFTTVSRAEELRDLTGMDYADLVAFRPQRLALHELLVRVTADLSVPDGNKIEDLGINFRQMTRTILARHIAPRQEAIAALYERTKAEVTALATHEMGALLAPPAEVATPSAGKKRGLLARWFAGPATPAHVAIATDESDADRARRRVVEWEHSAASTGDPVHRAAYRALARVVSSLLVRHGRVWGGQELLASLVADIACNECVSEQIGLVIDDCIREAVRDEGYVLLPRHEHPMVMNTKGASASGKSTLRPLQKRLAGQIGVDWSDFALISPDIWRKQLIDYESLGPIYKYGGAFSGDELQIVDQKLDRYMARKAERGDMSHLLIDRFRFDSFARDSEEAGSNLLTRFGDIVYLFFMITPPESLVERAWNRGLDVGRYKAVDDTLAHSVEAYSGMPEVFFTWAQRTDKRVHFEFLDNSVARGQIPRTVAFGWNDALTILDVGCMLDVCRFREVDVDAQSPSGLYKAGTPTDHTGFLRECVARFRSLDFADPATGRVYLRVARGAVLWCDPVPLASALASPRERAAVMSVLPAAASPAIPAPAAPTFLAQVTGDEPRSTLGAWVAR